MRNLSRLLIVGLLMSALGASQAQAGGKPQPPATPRAGIELAATITSSPLAITVNNDMSIGYQLDGRTMYFGPNDSGTYLTIDGVVYGPQPAANQEFAPLAYTPVSNVLSGTGTAADPFTITTRVIAGPTGIALVQTLTYVAGAQDYGIRFRLENSGGAKNVRVTHAADMYVNFPDNDLDFGYAFRDPLSGAIGSVTKTGQFVQAFIPNAATPPTAYQVSDWGRETSPLPPFWLYIGGSAGGAGAGLQSFIQSGYIDIVTGFQWDVSMPAGTGSVTSAAPAAVGVNEITMRGAFGTASDFNVRPFGVFLPAIRNP
jgi:hypothetical protein